MTMTVLLNLAFNCLGHVVLHSIWSNDDRLLLVLFIPGWHSIMVPISWQLRRRSHTYACSRPVSLLCRCRVRVNLRVPCRPVVDKIVMHDLSPLARCLATGRLLRVAVGWSAHARVLLCDLHTGSLHSRAGALPVEGLVWTQSLGEVEASSPQTDVVVVKVEVVCGATLVRLGSFVVGLDQARYER